MKENIKLGVLAAAPFLIGALVISLGGYFILDIWSPSVPLNFTWEGIGMFVSVCAGLGWVFHGTGFLIVKVN